MMPTTAKTNAIALRTIEVTNTSAIVVWLSRRHGRLATMIKGAYRPKSMFLGQFDLFYTCEIVFYSHAREHLHHIRECSPIDPRPRLRSDWKSFAAASYLADLVSRVTPWGAQHPEIFDFFERQLDHFAAASADSHSIFWHELKLLALLGLAPRLEACAACGRASAAVGDHARFSVERGGLICPDCAAGGGQARLQISKGTIAALKSWMKADDSAAARRTRIDRRQSAEIRSVLGAFLEHHLEFGLDSRRIALELLD
jgi:DNA repair protein RecO (recombination protein O)